jgi:hypothetical protein
MRHLLVEEVSKLDVHQRNKVWCHTCNLNSWTFNKLEAQRLNLQQNNQWLNQTRRLECAFS